MARTNTDLGGNTIYCNYVKTGFTDAGQVASNLLPTSANPSLVLTANTTLTTLNLGQNIMLNTATGFTVTLPPATGTGNQYVIYVQTTAAGGNYVVSAAGSDKIFGVITIGATASGTFVANNNVTITMNGTTQGGIKGSCLVYTDLGTNFWFVEGNLVGSGTAAGTGIS
jgi:hypothetical protein